MIFFNLAGSLRYLPKLIQLVRYNFFPMSFSCYVIDILHISRLDLLSVLIHHLFTVGDHLLVYLFQIFHRQVDPFPSKPQLIYRKEPLRIRDLYFLLNFCLCRSRRHAGSREIECSLYFGCRFFCFGLCLGFCLSALAFFFLLTELFLLFFPA